MRRVRQFAIWFAGFVCVLSALSTLVLAQDTATAAKHVGLPVDWSHRHIIVSNGATIRGGLAAAQDPRLQSLWLARTRASLGAQHPGPSASAVPKPAVGKKKMHVDWSMSLGNGSVAPTMSPAKYTFDVAANPSCASDFVVFGLNVPGVTGSPSRSIAAPAVPGASRTSNVVTITTTLPHNFAVGAQVVIAGVSTASFNGTFVIASVPSATTFTYAQIAVSATSGNGTATEVNQANVVAFNNLYSGTTGGNGLCGTGSASVMWAYNVSSAGGSILTSPSISLDGRKIAFVESAPISSIFRVLTYDPCTISTSQCAGNGASAGAPVVPGSGNAASMSSPVTYASATNTRSSPWIDYTNDVAYVGADNATVYRITGVFKGTPTLDTSFGTTPSVAGITLSNNCASAAATPAKLTSPVQVLGASLGLDTGTLFVGDDTGCLTAIDVASRSVIGSVTVGGHKVSSLIPAVYDSPIVDASNPNLLSVFATASSSNNATSFGGVSVLNGAAIIQAQLNSTGPTFTAVAAAPLGGGTTGSSNVDLHAPTFDNNYFTNNISSTTGFIYVCGTQASGSPSQTAPTLYRVGFTAGSPPTMNTATNGTPLLLSGTNGVECSPLLEFANSALAKGDLLFLSLVTANSIVANFDITGGMPSSANAFAAEPGGTSSIIIDNTRLATQQGSSIYFTTLANGTSGVCNGVKCAVKLTQLGLQ